MSTVYRGVELNDVGEASDWSPRERAALEDILDGLLLDCISTSIDTTNGHRHGKVYNGYSEVILDADNESGDIFFGDEALYSTMTVMLGDESTNAFRIIEDTDVIMSVSTNSAARNLYLGTSTNYGVEVGNQTKETRIWVPGSLANAFRLSSSADDFIKINNSTDQLQLKGKGGSFPLILNAASDVYTRGIQDITSYLTINGFSSLDSGCGVYMQTIGSLCFLKIKLLGFPDSGNGGEVNMTLPSGMTFFTGASSGEEFLGLVDGYNNSEIHVEVRYNGDTAHSIYFRPKGGNYDDWVTSGRIEIEGIVMVILDNPEFSLS